MGVAHRDDGRQIFVPETPSSHRLGLGTGPWESPSTDAARSVFRKRQCTYFEPYEAHGGYAASWAAIRIPSILLDGMPGSGTHLIPCLGFPGLPWCSVVPRLSST